jgi:hypothetical protein
MIDSWTDILVFIVVTVLLTTILSLATMLFLITAITAPPPAHVNGAVHCSAFGSRPSPHQG